METAQANTVSSDKYNIEAAEALAREALRLPISDAVPLYEKLLATFPTSSKYWKQYVEAHMAVGNDEAARLIFSRCLLICLHVPLWRCYIQFIRKVNAKKGLEGQEETKKAFEFMLNHVGTDITSGPVWMEYIAYLKSLPAQTPQEESQKMSAIRRTYQRAIVIPTHYVEQLWRDYENFENSVSRALAKALVAEYQPKYNSARAVYRECKKFADEIDWNMLAVPSSGSYKEDNNWMTWKKFLTFEKSNPQRIDSASANKRVVFAYEQCLMYLYHYPEVWYEYATWHASMGSKDAAVKVFQRALKALPDSEMLKYAYAELEESHGAPQDAKRVYELLIGDVSSATALSHIQFLRFLRRTEGAEAARKYFLDARKYPNCTYHVYVAYAMMAFCLDKDAKLAHNVFEAGLKSFMHEPKYILEYADFLGRLNDDRNIRALFERALSSLPPNDSVEVWKKYSQFEQTYGDLASMLKVEQRRKVALSGAGENGELVVESSLQDIASRYSYMDLLPCSSKDLENLDRQERLSRNVHKTDEVPVPLNGAVPTDRSSSIPISSNVPSKIIRPDVSTLVTPGGSGQKLPGPAAAVPSKALTNGVAANIGTTSMSDILKRLTPPLSTFVANLPAVEGPFPDPDLVISICLQSNIPLPTAKHGGSQLAHSGQASSSSNLSGSSKFKQTRSGQLGKRKDSRRQEEDEISTLQSQPLPKDAFKIRQMQKVRASTSRSGPGSVSYGSGLSGDLSGSSS